MMFEIRADGEGRLKLTGRLDAAQAGNARAAMLRVDQSLILDCAELDYISSAGIGVIVEAYRRLLDQHLELRLVNLAPRVRNVFSYAGLDKILKIE